MNCNDFDELLNHFNDKIETIYSLIPLSQLYEEFNDRQTTEKWNRNAVLDSNQLIFNSEDYSQRLLDKKPDLREISQMVIEMREMTQKIKLILSQQKQTIVSQKNHCHSDLDRLQRHCDHINQNIPTFLQNSWYLSIILVFLMI